MDKVINFINENSHPLFKCVIDAPFKALFDTKGFHFSERAQQFYNQIKHLPHLYVAYTKSQIGNYYIGKSFQNGGRWKRQHAYHLGTLAYHLLKTIRYDDQNHQHWIDALMNIETLEQQDNSYLIELKDEVYICFIPFQFYCNSINLDDKKEIRKINTDFEREVICSFQKLDYNLFKFSE